MRKHHVRKAVTLAAAGGLLMGAGCSFSGLAANVWKGFGYSLGGIPAQIVTDLFIADLVDNIIGNNNNNTGA